MMTVLFCVILASTFQIVVSSVPDEFQVQFDTSAGIFDIMVTRSWAPNGADRFYELVQSEYFDNAPFFGMVKFSTVQFGISSDPTKTAFWKGKKIEDDKVKASNMPGTVTFVASEPNSRTSQFYINLGHNHKFDGMGCSPFGKIASDGMQVVNNLNFQYGRKPSESKLTAHGAVYWRKEFPKLDYIITARVVVAINHPPVPEKFQVQFDTSAGIFDVMVNRSWSPNGAGRFYELVKSQYFDDAPFFSMVRFFVATFGISSVPTKTSIWKTKYIKDDKVKQSNMPGTLSFVSTGPHTRTSQLYINLGHNYKFDDLGFSPIGKITQTGMKVVNRLNFEYGEEPSESKLTALGAVYWKKKFPKLDYIITARIVASTSYSRPIRDEL